MNKSDIVGRQIWDVLVQAYHQGGRTKVTVPVPEVMFALCGVMANVLSQVGDARERQEFIGKIATQTGMLVDSIRERPNLDIPSRPSLIIPH